MRGRFKRLARPGVVRLTGQLQDWQLAVLTGVAGRLDRRIVPLRERRRVDALADEDWLQWLYEDTLGREADVLGLEHWRQRLRGGMTREAFQAFFLSSDEAGY